MTQCIFFALQLTKTLHLSNISPLFVKEVNTQFSVMIRFGKLMSSETTICLYTAFIVPHLYYCSMVQHFSSKQDSDKLDLLNKRFFFSIEFLRI